MIENKKVQKRPMFIDPEYVPADKLWYWDGMSAPSLSELLKKLPKGTQVRNYYKGDCPAQKFANANSTRSLSVGFIDRTKYVIS